MLLQFIMFVARIAKPTSSETCPLHSSLISLPFFCAFTQRPVSLFSTPCTLFLNHNLLYPSYFLKSAHSLPKTPGGSIGISNQVLEPPLTPIKSKYFIGVPSNPFRMLLFRKRGGGPFLHFHPLIRNCQQLREMAHSSCARIISTRTRESANAMSWSRSGFSLAKPSLRAASNRTPRNSSLAQASARTSAEFSPIPAVNTSASIPPRLAAIAPMPEARRCTKISNASFARSVPFFMADTISRISPEIPETPKSPERLFSNSSNCSPERFCCRIRYVRIPGSTEPLRVPIINPSSGVNPMVVSTLFPLRIAASEQPFPRWQLTRRSFANSFPSNRAARRAQY